jgi:predicted ATPase
MIELTPQQRREKTLEALVARVEGLSARLPVLMVFEDVHWSDPTTRESLDLLIDRVPTMRALVIITFRPEFAPAWIGRAHVTLMSLNRLSRRQRAAMITGVTGGKALPQEIADQIIDRTDGVPLFIEELTKSVVESGLLTKAGDHYSVAGPVALAIPKTLQASLLARLDRLAPTREVAQIGAALGRSFSHELGAGGVRRLGGGVRRLGGCRVRFRAPFSGAQESATNSSAIMRPPHAPDAVTAPSGPPPRRSHCGLSGLSAAASPQAQVRIP